MRRGVPKAAAPRWAGLLAGLVLVAVCLGGPSAASACSPAEGWFAKPDIPVVWKPWVTVGGLSKKVPDPRFYRVVWSAPGPCGPRQTHVHLGWAFAAFLATLGGGAVLVRRL